MTNSNPQSSGSQDSIDSLIAKFEDYCLCDEYHYGDHDGIKGNHDPSDGHMEFDEEKFKAAILAWHNTQLKATLRTIHKTIVDNDVAGPVKWQVEDMQSNLEKQWIE